MDVGAAIRNERSDAAVVLVDCLSFLVSNLLIATDVERDRSNAKLEERVDREIQQLLDAVTGQGADLVVVSNEVGMSLVPDNRLGRLYRDLLGRANQSMAAAAGAVYLMVAGVPLTVKQPDGR
jgi:adenosyl cobinamide kinase/adenosyl cobinamide phosphate guanylyltransferase